MTYNLLNYYSGSDTSRNTHFRTVLEATRPDILIVQEILSQTAVNVFHTNVLNAVEPGAFAAGSFLNGPDTDNAIFYRSSKFTFLSNDSISTGLRTINQFVVVHTAYQETLRVYSVHLKASTGTDNEAQRAAEVDSLRKVTNALPHGSDFIVVGDFNIYKSGEAAYQKLVQDDPGNDGHFIDPTPITGTWNNSAYAAYHTQSPRVRSFGGGSTGGLDDRFDMILHSRAVGESGGITFVSGSCIPFGNDGNHYNDSINRMPNTAVSQSVANALHDASDHLPVLATFVFEDPLPVQMVSFTAVGGLRGVELRWFTATETNNYGFEIERRLIENGRWKMENWEGEAAWVKVGFVAGAGTSTSPREYSYTDEGVAPGRYAYRIKQIDNGGAFRYFGAVEVEIGAMPMAFTLMQNYPNPFNPVTTVGFTLAEDGPAVLKVFDVLGRQVAVLYDAEAQAGQLYTATFDASRLATGVYIYTLESNGQRLIKKMNFVK
jgi:exonuclease III